MTASLSFLDGRVVLHPGDCREVLRGIAEASIDSVVTDPPYSLVSIGKRFGKSGSAPTKDGDVYARASAGFMGQQWDTGETAFAVEFWAQVLRVLKPGGHVVAFSGTRTYHRMVCAIEDAGFEIRDQLAWAYGSGFPKSHNHHGDWKGWGTALKPAWEPIVLARKPLAATVAETLLAHGTGALNIDGCRVGAEGGTRGYDAGPSVGILGNGLNGSFGKPVPGLGRWPANIVHDGSDEVLAAFPDAPGQLRVVTGAERSKRTVNAYGDFGESRNGADPRGDAGSAARFFYGAKADADDRLGSKHPTVKPVDLMQWLCRLVTPPGGRILDPFAGTGTTGEAAFREGFGAVLIEREPQFQADIARRMDLVLAGPASRKAASAKARAKDDDAGPLFSTGEKAV